MAGHELLEAALAAHGGLECFKEVRGLKGRLCYGGLWPAQYPARRALRSAEFRMSLEVPRASFWPYPHPGCRGLYNNDVALIASDAGPIVEERCHPRRHLVDRSWIRPWDRLDMLYYFGHAFWNYMNVPFLLTRPGFHLEELAPYTHAGRPIRRLKARFPDWVPTHCQEQVFHFGPDGLLWRHDYVPESLGPFRIARLCEGYVAAGGIMVPTRIRAYLRDRGDRPRLWPPVAWLDLAGVEAL